MKTCGIGWAGLLLVYGAVILIPDENLASIFLPLGATVGFIRLLGVWARLKGPNRSDPHIPRTLLAMAGDLVALIAVHHGVLQALIELNRGNILGAILGLAVVTPILALLTRALALGMGSKVFRI